MALSRIFNEQDITHLLDQNSMPPFGARNTALIMGALAWGLTPLELSKLRVKDVMSVSGEFYRIWVLPEYIACSGKARELHTEEQVLPYFENYIKFRNDKKWKIFKSSGYRGMSPEDAFFLNDRGNEYAISQRKNKPENYYAKDMMRQLKRLIDNSDLYGATPSSFRDSFINLIYRENIEIKDLMDLTGIENRKALRNKIRPNERQLKDALNSIFSRVKMPKHLQEEN